jgi:hypothetical protein
MITTEIWRNAIERGEDIRAVSPKMSKPRSTATSAAAPEAEEVAVTGFHWVALLISVMSTCFHLMFYLMSADAGFAAHPCFRSVNRAQGGALNAPPNVVLSSVL